MDKSHDLHIPDYVPDELVEQYGAGPATRPRLRRLRHRATTEGPGRPYLYAVAQVCCVAIVAGILIALIATAPKPLIAAAAVLGLLVFATITGAVAAHALLRATRNDCQRR